MDIHCQKCGEPWDSYSCHVRKRKGACEAWSDEYRTRCERGLLDTGLVETKDAPGALASAGYERNTDRCDTCDGTGKVPVPDGPEECESCEDCAGDGWRVVEDYCESCGDELEDSYYAQVFVGDGALYCTGCALARGWVVDALPCPECDGSGEIEETEETDLGGEREIRDFLAGKGCPCCAWGSKLWQCQAGACWGKAGAAGACSRCGAELVYVGGSRAAARAGVVVGLLGEDIDGIAALCDERG